MSDISERIRKLLSLAADKGATEDEAATAMRMATSLMAKHGIEVTLGDDRDKKTARIGQRMAKAFKSYEIILAQAASQLYGTTFLMYDRGKQGIVFAGREDNIQATEITLLWLINQLEALYKIALPRGLTQPVRAEFRRTFKDACAVRVRSRAYKMVEDMKTNNQVAQSATGGTALVVADHFTRLVEEAHAAFKASQGEIKTIELKVRHGNGTEAGRAAGDRVKLNKEIS